MCCDLWASSHILQNSLGAQTISQNRKGKIRQSKTKRKENDPLDQTAQLAARPAHLAHPPNRPVPPRSLSPLPCSPDQGRNRRASPPDPPRRRRGGDKEWGGWPAGPGGLAQLGHGPGGFLLFCFVFFYLFFSISANCLGTK